MNKYFLIILVLLLLIPIAAAAPAIKSVQTSDHGLIIEYPKFDFYPIGSDVKLFFHVFNESNGVFFYNNTAKCYFHLFNHTEHLFSTQVLTFDNIDWFVTIKKGNFTTYDDYGYIFQCNTTTNDLGGFADGKFQIVPEKTNPNFLVLNYTPISYILIFFIILVLISIVGIFYIENIALKITSGMCAAFFTNASFMIAYLLTTDMGLHNFTSILLPFYSLSVYGIWFTLLGVVFFLLYYVINLFFGKKDRGNSLDQEVEDID